MGSLIYPQRRRGVLVRPEDTDQHPQQLIAPNYCLD